MFPKLKLPKFEISPIKRFLFTYKKVLKIAWDVNPNILILVTLANSFWGLTNLPSLYINKILIDLVISNLGNPNLNQAIRLIVFLVALRALIEFIRSGLSRISNNLVNNLAEGMVAHLDLITGRKLNSLDIPTIESPDFQDKFKKIEREANNRLWGMIGPLTNIPIGVFTIVSGIIPLLSFNPWIFLLVVLVTIPDVFINAKLAKKDYQMVEVLAPKWRLWEWISSHIKNSRHFYENKILSSTGYLVKKLAKVQKEVLEFQYQRRMRRVYLRTFGDILPSLLALLVNAYFFIQALMGKISLGTAQLLYSATNTLALGFSGLLNNAVSVYENYLFVSDLTWFLNLPPAYNPGKFSVSEVFSKGIEFENVWFKYPNSDTWVLKGVNFSIKPKENIAIVGENGAGKTTLIKLLCGFYKPNKGEIMVNGRNVFDYNPEKYWNALGVLFQDFSEYPFTARESMGLGDVKKVNKLKDIKKAAKLTGVDSFIESLPLGYENPLNKEFNKGISPSKGQWQRIALARIFLRDSKIIALDEPTSNVDPKAEEEIFEKIIQLAKEKILILISHRFSTVRRADKILLLENGKVLEEGTHEELMKSNGEYSHLFELQAKGYQ